MSELRREYLSSPFGQTHWTICEDEDTEHPPLLCLHPIPYSGAFFKSIMPLLPGREVLAPDLPHYGASDGPGRVCSIEEFADALESGLRPLPTVDVLGFHTGCLVAAELALRHQNVRRVILIDVPYFSPEQQAAIVVKDQTITPALECLTEPWSFSVERNLQGTALSRAYELFVDQIRAGEKETWGFKSAFKYPCEERFSRLGQRVKVIATVSVLRDATVACAASIPNAELTCRDDIEFAVFEAHVKDIAVEVTTFLDV